MLPSVGEDAIDRGEADPDVVGDRLAHHAPASEPQDVRRLRLGGGSPALVLALALGLRNALTLSPQHHLALEFGDPPDNAQNELARWRARIEVHGQDAKRGFPLLDPSNDLTEIDDRTRQTIDFGDDKDSRLRQQSPASRGPGTSTNTLCRPGLPGTRHRSWQSWQARSTHSCACPRRRGFL